MSLTDFHKIIRTNKKKLRLYSDEMTELKTFEWFIEENVKNRFQKNVAAVVLNTNVWFT